MNFEVRMDESYSQNKKRVVPEFEIEFTRTVLARFNGNISECARALRMDRKQLHEMVVRHDLQSYRTACQVASGDVKGVGQ